MDYNERTTAVLEALVSPVTWNSILRECAAIEADNPYFPSGFQWVLEYKRFQVEVAKGNLLLGRAHLKRAIGLNPYSDALLQEYLKFYRQEAPVTVVALILANKADEEKAIELGRQFEAGQIQYVIATGADTEAIHHPCAIQVDGPDGYQGLPRKAIAAYTWIYENLGPHVGVLKIEVGMSIGNPLLLARKAAQFIEQNVYAGLPASQGEEHDRCLHWDLCDDAALKPRVYGRPYYRAWAEGQAYFLAPEPLQKLVMSFIRFPAQLDGEYYEDKLIGDVLMFEGVALHAIGNFADIGLLQTPLDVATGTQ